MKLFLAIIRPLDGEIESFIQQMANEPTRVHKLSL